VTAEQLTPEQIAMLTPAEAGAALDRMTQAYRGAPPPVPTNATEAAARLAALAANPDWSARFNKGGVAENREFQQLTTQITAGDHPANLEIESVDGVTDPSALPRRVYDGLIEALGLPEAAEKYVRDIDAGRRTDRPTAAEGVAAKEQLTALIGEAAWRQKFDAGNLEARNQFNALNLAISYAVDADR
jgi:hypothetical protein